MSDFAAPAAGGDGWSPSDSIDHLVVIEVLGQEQNVDTDYGLKDPIRANVHDITAGATYDDTLIFQKVLIGSLKQRVGQKVLGRIYLGEPRKGQKPPYLIEDKSGDAAAAAQATAYLDAYKAGQFTAPAAPAADGWPTASAPAAPAAAAAAPAATPDLNDPAVIAALAALQKQGLTSEPPF